MDHCFHVNDLLNHFNYPGLNPKLPAAPNVQSMVADSSLFLSCVFCSVNRFYSRTFIFRIASDFDLLIQSLYSKHYLRMFTTLTPGNEIVGPKPACYFRFR